MTDRKQHDAISRLFGGGLISEENGGLSAPTTLPDPMDALTSIGMVLGFVYKKTGEDGLRQLLAPDDSDPPRFSQEDALDGAAELASVGMGTAAKITGECAAQLPSMTDQRFCPYKPPMYTDRNNVKAWLRSQERRQLEREAQRQQGLKATPRA